ncbi:LecA/PA-IL family lectin [Enterobacter sp. 22452]|uniref:LecA/PA-IL family lectin n=1 Tax=Enterobacter TaxID=547 RepID=UPI003F85EF53
MSYTPAWSGEIPANVSTGVNTGIELNKGDEITIIASGWIRYGKEEFALASPFGRVKEGLATNSDTVLKARFGESGKGHSIGSGEYKWSAPESGVLYLYVADTDVGYKDNSGSFSAKVYK